MKTRYFAWVAVLILAAAPASAQDRFTTYGFFDTEFEASNRNPNDFTATFDQHHFNVVTIYRMNEKWRVFGEIEWEHGVALEDGGGSGLVALERAWVEYAHSDGFKVLVGKFLTPFGVYNQMHDATPTFLSSFLPDAIYGKHATTTGGSDRLYAKFSTGVQVRGNLFPADWQLEYAAYLTNGRGPDASSSDNNDNKGIGGRVVLQSPGESFRLGASFYQDRDGNQLDTRHRTVAADIGVGASGFWLEAEGFLPQLQTVDQAGALLPAYRDGLGYYVQASYRTDVGVTPFARYGAFDPDRDVSNDGNSDVVVGLNLALQNFAFLKGEVQFINFQDPAVASYEKFVGSIAIAF